MMEIKAMPTFLVVSGGAVVDKIVGANPEELRKRIDAFLHSHHSLHNHNWWSLSLSTLNSQPQCLCYMHNVHHVNNTWRCSFIFTFHSFYACIYIICSLLYNSSTMCFNLLCGIWNGAVICESNVNGYCIYSVFNFSTHQCHVCLFYYYYYYWLY